MRTMYTCTRHRPANCSANPCGRSATPDKQAARLRRDLETIMDLLHCTYEALMFSMPVRFAYDVTEMRIKCAPFVRGGICDYQPRLFGMEETRLVAACPL